MASVLGVQATWTAGSAAFTPGATSSLDVLRATSIDMAFWAFLAASAAGVAARGFTQYLRDKHTSGERPFRPGNVLCSVQCIV